MNQWRPITIIALAAALAGAAVWGCCGLTKHVIVAVDRFGDAGAAVGLDAQTVAATIADINRPCKGIAGPDSCGTLAQVNKTVIKIGDAIVTTQLQERSAAPHVIAAMDALNESARKLGATADALTGTSNAATVSANALTATLGDAGTTIRAAQPLLASFAESGDALNAILKRKAITDVLDNAASITSSGAGILADGKKVADKETADFLKPVRWYMQPVKKAGDILDISGAIARHMP